VPGQYQFGSCDTSLNPTAKAESLEIVKIPIRYGAGIDKSLAPHHVKVIGSMGIVRILVESFANVNSQRGILHSLPIVFRQRHINIVEYSLKTALTPTRLAFQNTRFRDLAVNRALKTGHSLPFSRVIKLWRNCSGRLKLTFALSAAAKQPWITP